MMDYFDLIDDYKNGLLSNEQLVAFENEMSKDPKLLHAVENYALIKNISAGLIEDEVRQEISKLQSHQIQKNNSYGKLKWIYAIAGILIVLIALYFIVVKYNENSQSEVIAMLYQGPDPENSRGTEEDLNKIDSAINYYKLNDYDKALKLFSQKISNDSIAKIADCYKAHIYFEKEDYSLSEKIFKSLIHHTIYGPSARINLLAIYILTGQKAKGRIMYEDLLKQGVLSDVQKTFAENKLKE
jgi:tetratricopeptide (TPR) repeat protein